MFHRKIELNIQAAITERIVVNAHIVGAEMETIPGAVQPRARTLSPVRRPGVLNAAQRQCSLTEQEICLRQWIRVFGVRIEYL